MKNFFNYYFYKSLNNTNDEIKRLNKNNLSKSNLAIFSLEQKNGRGRSGNLWKSSNGDLTCSFLINKIFDIRNKLIRTLIDHSVVDIEAISIEWDGKDLSGGTVDIGVYIYQIRLGAYQNSGIIAVGR